MNRGLIDGPYLRGLLRRSSEGMRGEIVARLPSGDYTVLLEERDNQITASVLTPGVSYTVGQVVKLSRGDGARRVVGDGYTIDGLAAAGARNSSLAARFRATKTRTQATVAGIKVAGVFAESCDLVAGGAAVAILIPGNGFTVAPTYGDAGIVNDSAATVTDTLITLSVKATTAAIGRYSLTVAGVVISEFFHVNS
jgi:hypothetical protein